MANIRVSSKTRTKESPKAAEDPVENVAADGSQVINEEPFSKRMRRETRDVHKISDALVNAKFLMSTKDPRVWAQGLVSFYEVFRFLEQNVPVELLPEQYRRTAAFERDLVHYLGVDWRDDYIMHPAVRSYLNHLTDINKRQPLLLLAYVYHLYMGLLSGGQILQKKRALFRSRDEPIGEAVTRFDGYDISELKNQMRTLIDTLAEDFDESLKSLLIVESRMVFHLNNEIVKVCGGSLWSAVRNAIIIAVVMAGVMWFMSFPSKRS